MNNIFKFIALIFIILLLAGCGDQKVKLLNKNFTNTETGTIKNKRLIEYKKIEKKKPIIKVEKKITVPKKEQKKS